MSQTWRLSSCGHAKHRDQKQREKERVHFRLQSIMKGSQDRNLRRELKQRSWKNGLLPMTFLVDFLKPPTTTCAGVAPPTVGWSLSHKSSVKKERNVLHLFLMMLHSARQSQDLCSPWLSRSWEEYHGSEEQKMCSQHQICLLNTEN